MAARRVITGNPGESWVNRGKTVAYQFRCSFQNSCARCIQDAGKISREPWPVPYHRGCACEAVPVLPGHRAATFVDYAAEVAALAPAAQRRVMGKSSYALVESGAVAWADVVTPTRIRSFAEVVDQAGLTERDLVNAGVSPRQARQAHEALPERRARARAEAAVQAEATAQAEAEAKAKAKAEAEAKAKAKAEAEAKAKAEAVPPPTPLPAQPPPATPVPQFGRSKADVRLHDSARAAGLDEAGMERMLRERTGLPLSLRDVASAVGATDDAIVRIGPWRHDAIDVYVDHPTDVYQAQYFLSRDPGTGAAILKIDTFLVADAHQGQGLGTEVFGRQIENATSQGFARIELTAARSSMMNGYYTWPRFGFDGPLPETITGRLASGRLARPAMAPDATTVGELMATAEGRAWWKEEGRTFDATFDLAEGSPSRAIWDGYLQARAAQSSPTSPRPRADLPTRPAPPSLPAPAVPPPRTPIGAKLAAWTEGDAQVQALQDLDDDTTRRHRAAAQSAQGRYTRALAALETAAPAEQAEIRTVARLAQDDLLLARDRVRAAVERQRPAALAQLTQPEAERFGWQHTTTGKMKGLPELVDGARAFVEPLVRAGGGAAASPLEWKSTRAGARASYFARQITLSPSDEVATAVHEWGHAIEAQVPGAKQAAQQFLAHRVGDEAPTRLADLFPDHGYAPDETGRRDHFDDHLPPDRAYYAGKTYPGGVTEILSLGLESLHRDPVGFARDDPEYCKFILGVLSGDLR